MSSLSTYQNVRYLSNLSRPSGSKGSLLINTGTQFNLQPPSSNGQVLLSDTTAPTGSVWSNPNKVLGGSIGTMNIAIPTIGSTVYFLGNTSTSNPVTLVVPKCKCIMLTINTNSTGYSTNPTRITGGFINLYFCYVDPNTQNTLANLKYISTGTTTPPATADVRVFGTSILNSALNFSCFTSIESIDIPQGVQFGIRMTNNLTVSSSNTFNTLNVVTLFRYDLM